MADIDMKDSFLEQMLCEGVKPINTNPSVANQTRKKPSVDLERIEARKRAATQGEDCGLTLDPIEWLNPLDPIGWCKEGIQQGVYRNLRLAKYSLDARLNIANLSTVAARDELLRFVKECTRLDIRALLIHHGRGNSSRSKGNQLKSYLNLWLKQVDEVMAFHSAQPQHGGSASTYVLLRKSEQARLDNLEKHQKRSR